jgi:NOL1/NOP2/fmu family ribosome biogenesis protein
MIQEDSLSPSSSRGRNARNVFELMERVEVEEMWRSRFGIEEDAFKGYKFYRKAQSIWVISEADLPKISYEALGLRMISLKDRPWKPTTCALQMFGKSATKNVIHLNEEQARRFLAGETSGLEAECEAEYKPEYEPEYKPECEPGYVIVFYRGDILGCGLYSRGKLSSQLPKERRMANFAEGEEYQ